MSASRQRLLSRRSRTQIRSPPGLGAPPTIGKTCLWIISKDVCLPNAFSRKPLRGPLVTGTNRPGGPNALPLYDVKHPQSLPQGHKAAQEPSRIHNLNRTKPRPNRGDTRKDIPKPQKVVEPDGIEPTT